jgi:hypothetical protein
LELRVLSLCVCSKGTYKGAILTKLYAAKYGIAAWLAGKYKIISRIFSYHHFHGKEQAKTWPITKIITQRAKITLRIILRPPGGWVSQTKVFRFTKKSRLYFVRNIDQIVLFLSREYLKRNDVSNTIYPWFRCSGTLWFAKHYLLVV